MVKQKARSNFIPKSNFRGKRKAALSESRRKMGTLSKKSQKSDAKQRQRHKKMFGNYPKSW